MNAVKGVVLPSSSNKLPVAYKMYLPGKVTVSSGAKKTSSTIKLDSDEMYVYDETLGVPFILCISTQMSAST